MGTTSALPPQSLGSRQAGPTVPLMARTVIAGLLACLLAIGAAACSRGEPRPLDADGVARAILNEKDFPERDGWSSTGVSLETADAPVAANGLTRAKGMPEACREAFDAWVQADPRRAAGATNNFTKFSSKNLDDAVIIQLAVRGFEQPPVARAKLRDVARACAGTMTLTPQPTAPASPSGGTRQSSVPARVPATNTVTIAPNRVDTPDADGLRITMPLDGRPATVVTVVAQRGQNLVQVVGLGAANRDIPSLVHRVLDAQVKKLEETAG